MNLTGKYFFHGKSYYKQNKNPNDKLGKIFPTYIPNLYNEGEFL
jgi:hypothetical protein